MISRKFGRVKRWSVVLWPGRKSHWVSSKSHWVSSLWFNYRISRHSFFKALATNFPKEAELRYVPVVGEFTPVSLFVSIVSLLEHQAIWHTGFNQRTPSFEHIRFVFIAVCSLPRLQCFDSKEDFGCSDVIFLPQMYFVCVRLCDIDWV